MSLYPGTEGCQDTKAAPLTIDMMAEFRIFEAKLANNDIPPRKWTKED